MIRLLRRHMYPRLKNSHARLIVSYDPIVRVAGCDPIEVDASPLVVNYNEISKNRYYIEKCDLFQASGLSLADVMGTE
jgi:hypothetical protein